MKLEVQQQRRIHVSIEEAWRVLSDLGSIERWSPDVAEASLTGDQRDGEGTSRSLTFHKPMHGKKQITERVTEWHKGRGYVYEVQGGMGPFHRVRNQWWLDERGPDTLLTFNTRMHTKNPLFKLAGQYIRWRTRKGLAPMLDGFKVYLEEGEDGIKRLERELKEKQQGRSGGARPVAKKTASRPPTKAASKTASKAPNKPAPNRT